MKSWGQKREFIHDNAQKQLQRFVIRGFLGTCLIFVSAFNFLYTNTLATVGQDLRDLHVEISSIEKENERLTLEMIEQQSLLRVQEAAEALGLVDVSTYVYVNIPQHSVTVAQK